MKGPYIDRSAPEMTGDKEQDIRNLSDYCQYLAEQLNYALSVIYKTMTSMEE